MRGPWTHCSYDMSNCCTDKKTIVKQKGGSNTKVIKGRGKIEFSGEKDKETMEKKYSDVEFEEMNSLTFTTTYKGNEMFDLKKQLPL